MRKNNNFLFNKFKDRLLNIDPVSFAERNLKLDGESFRISGNGYKPFADIYRYIGLQALNRESKPIVLVKGRQVGATTMAVNLECYFATCGLFGNEENPPMRIFHLFPSLPLAAGFSKQKLDSTIKFATPSGELDKRGRQLSIIESKLDKSTPANDTQHFKHFLNGCEIWIDSTGLDGDRIRGRTGDIALFDEVQDMSTKALGAVGKILSQSHYGPIGQGIQVFFGTPKQKGTAYYNLWTASSQQYYHLRCKKCDELFPLYRPDVNWEDIWLYGYIVKCSECGEEQDKRQAAERGAWVPLNGEEDADYVGYHINQLYIPSFTKEVIVKQKPENHATNTEMIYQNEVLGEFYDGESGLISAQELEEKCADKERGFSREILVHEGPKVYAGFDWGQKGEWSQLQGAQKGQSYSCAVILSAIGPQLFNIEFATRLKKTDPGYKEEVVEELFKRYTIHHAVGDIGDAHDLTHVLQKKYGEQFVASRAVGKLNGHIKYDDTIFPKEIRFEKDYYISELVGLLKKGAIRFPYKDYDKIYWLITHCTSMDIKVTKDRSGDPVRRFVKGTTPNDGFMALLNAYLAWKFDVTHRFSLANPQLMDLAAPSQRRGGPQIPAILGQVKF